jgi:hypothetical protein
VISGAREVGQDLCARRTYFGAPSRQTAARRVSDENDTAADCLPIRRCFNLK